MGKKALVFLAEGFEEVEAITPVDYLRRAGVEVCTSSLGSNNEVTGSHGIKIISDTNMVKLLGENSLDPALWDAVVIPGGMPGAANIAASGDVASFLKNMARAGKWVCAICASPAVVLAPLGLLKEKKFTCYPGLEEKVSEANWSEERVVTDGRIITSRGAGTAGEFSAEIIANLVNESESKNLAEKVLLK